MSKRKVANKLVCRPMQKAQARTRAAMLVHFVPALACATQCVSKLEQARTTRTGSSYLVSTSFGVIGLGVAFWLPISIVPQTSSSKRGLLGLLTGTSKARRHWTAVLASSTRRYKYYYLCLLDSRLLRYTYWYSLGAR